MQTGLHRSKTCRFPRHRGEIDTAEPSVSTRIDELQTGRLREARLLSPPRLSTGRERFPSSRSRLSKAVCKTRQQSYHLLAARYYRAVDALAGKGAPVRYSPRHVQLLRCRFLRASRAETPQGSLPACAAGDGAKSSGAPRIRPTTRRPSLFPTPLPAAPSVGLTAFFPVLRQERYGLTTFRTVDKDG
jgi:hypothetical protein